MPACKSHEDCIHDALAKAESLCQGRGLRFTDLRRQVLAMIWENHGPAKAYDLLARLKGHDMAKPPTVYRTLDFLQENGLVHKLNSLNAYIGCSHPLVHQECYFLICDRCGEVQECCNPALKKAIAGTAEDNGFSPAHTTLEISGQCEGCRG